jgi:hypothetical protein
MKLDADTLFTQLLFRLVCFKHPEAKDARCGLGWHGKVPV